MTIRVVIHHALERITLDVDLSMDGGLTALLGPSGGGKTRTLEVIAGLLRPASGLVVVDGEVLGVQDGWRAVEPDRHAGIEKFGVVRALRVGHQELIGDLRDEQLDIEAA